jgi:glycosyltransferase involved in cell wall biosynthesis
MRIATMVRGMLPVPRPHDMMYSPLDVAVAISEELNARGHHVTYYGPKGTKLRVNRIRTSDLKPFIHDSHDLQSLLNSPDLFTSYVPSLYDHVLVREMFAQAATGEYDLLHFHHFETAMPYAAIYPQVPVAYTIHDAIDPRRRMCLEAYASPNQHFISISNNQRRGAPDLQYAATVYNGIDTTRFKPNGPPEDYLLVVGRIVPEKGIKEAVQIAIKSNSRLFIIGEVLKSDQWYFDAHIKPFLNEKILFLGYIEHPHLVSYYQKARALLMPIQWEEPFGLTMAESMACGTPVVAMRRGSVPEVVVHGKTGFIANNTEEIIRALKKLDTIDRQACRSHVLDRFSLKQMVHGYETAFARIVHEHHRKYVGAYVKGKIRRTIAKAARGIASKKS